MELSLLEVVLAILMGVFGTGRLTRIIVHDGYPPAVWVREKWEEKVGEKWGLLLNCIWCAQPYVVLIFMTWGYFSDFHWTWWAFWGWLALSQAGSQNLAYDEPAE